MNIDLLDVATFCAAVIMVTLTLALAAFVIYVAVYMIRGMGKNEGDES